MQRTITVPAVRPLVLLMSCIERYRNLISIMKPWVVVVFYLLALGFGAR